jgi:hypothetical protein
MGLKANGSRRVRLGVLVLELILTVIPNLMNAIEIFNDREATGIFVCDLLFFVGLSAGHGPKTLTHSIQQ